LIACPFRVIIVLSKGNNIMNINQIKSDENGWATTKVAKMAVTDTMTLLVQHDPNEEIVEVDLTNLMQSVGMYFTRLEFAVIRAKWIWNILTMKA
jgi:hypothetical protein